jgi:hypothetical protein
MLTFSNYENFSVTKQDIDELQTKLNNYSGSMESLIGAIDASFVANNYITGTYNVGDYNQELIDLSMVNNLSANFNAGNIEELKDSMDIINEKMNEYNIKKEKLNNQINHYNLIGSLNPRLIEGNMHRNYYLMLIWIIILFIVGYASFFSVIEEKNDINIISKIILFLLLLFVGYFIFNNLYLYFSGYQINYTPLK